MGALNLLHPWLLAGLAGASLPVLIHLIGRKRAPTVFFAAFDFLMAVNKRLARRERLRQLLLLILRTLAIAALVFAVARPMPHHSAAAANINRRLALVFDTSGSMSYVQNGKTLLSRAKEQALEFVSHLQPGDAVTLVVAGTEVRAHASTPTLNHSEIRAAIDALQDDDAEGVADLGTAIDKALAQLGASGSGASLVVLSDLSRNSFDHVRPTAMDPPPEIRLVDAAERRDPAALGNMAVEHVGVDRSSDAPAERRFKVVIRNNGADAVGGRAVELRVNGQITQRGYIDVPARSTAEKTLTHSFETPGVFQIEVRLVADDADGYPNDDSLLLNVEIARGVRVLAVNGEPRTTPYEDELFFVERALGAVPKGDPPINLSIVEPGDLEASVPDLTAYDVVILAHVASLPEPQVKRLETYVQGGGGLLFTLGSQVRFERFNALFENLLPHPLRDLQMAADPAAGTPALAITEFDWDHPVLQGLGRSTEEGLRASHTSRYFNLDVGASIKARPILRFDNGAPALIEARGQQAGRVLLWTTSIDLDLTDVPLRSAFPALLQRAVRYLAKAVDVPAQSDLREGGAAELPLPTGAVAMALVSPGGERRELQVATPAKGRLKFDNLDEKGVWRVEVKRATWTHEPRLDLAVGPSLDESDFLPIRADKVADALGQANSSRTVSVTLGDSQQGDPFAVRGFASYLLLALCLLFISESALAARG